MKTQLNETFGSPHARRNVSLRRIKSKAPALQQ